MTSHALNLRDRLRLTAMACASFVLLLVPLQINGAPVYWLGDSLAYIHGGSTAWSYATGMETRFASIEKSGVAGPSGPNSQDEAPADQVAGAQDLSFLFSSGRSPYYAALIVLAAETMGAKGPVLLQAFLMTLSMTLLVKAVFGRDLTVPALLCIAGLGLSAAGLFTTVLLPDFLAPIGLMAAGILIAFWHRLSGVEIGLWMMLLVLSLISHSTHLAMVLLLVLLAIPVQLLLTGRAQIRGTLCIFAAIATVIAANSLSQSLIEERYGYKPRSLPMVAASLFADGPARTYLNETCPENGFVYCAFLDNKATEVDQFMWATDADLGVFALSDTETRLALSEQQWHFLGEVLKYDFPGQVIATAQKILRQLTDNSLTQFIYDEGDRTKLQTLPEPDRSLVEQSLAFEGRFDFVTLSRISQWIVWGSAILLAGLMALRTRSDTREQRPDHLDTRPETMMVFTAIVILGILINASLTGAASQPQGRYSARICLLLPVMVAIWGGWMLRNRPLQRRAAPL